MKANVKDMCEVMWYMRTVGERLLEEMEKIAKALESIPQRGFMRQMLVLYLKEKTGLGKQKIEAILDAIVEFKKEIENELKKE